MQITKEQLERAEELVRQLQSELDYAYQGIRNLPAEHSAKIAYNAADSWLWKPWG